MAERGAPANRSGAEQGGPADGHHAPRRLDSASIEQPTDLAVAMKERELLEELGEWALRCEKELPETSTVRQEASRLRNLARPERRQAA